MVLLGYTHTRAIMPYIILILSLIHCVTSQGEIHFTVIEEVHNNFIIGNIHQEIFRHMTDVTPLDYTYKSLSIIDPFYLDSKTSDLRTRKRVDREILCPSQHSYQNFNTQNCKINFKIIQTKTVRKDSNPLEEFAPQIVDVVIQILDINDNPPKWRNPKVYFELPEHSTHDSRIALPLATDPDQAPTNTTKRYLITHQSVKDGFILHHVNEDKKKESLWLVVNKDFDREVQTNINVKIEAFDGAVEPLSGELEINISLIDINDKSPRFIKITNHKLILENIPLRTTILKLKAHDDDQSDQQNLKFSFDNSVDEVVKNRFYINPNSGEIITAGYIDYETQSEYIIPVIVSDGKHLDRTDVVITVQNLNDNPPEIIVFYVSGSFFKTPRQSSSYQASVAENKDQGFVLASFSVFDKDNNEVQHLPLDCRIEPPSDGFELKRLTQKMKDHFQILTSKRFDRELMAHHSFQLICFDRETAPLSTSVTFDVSITDVNDNAPTFKEPSANMRGTPTYSIKEDSPIGTFIIQVKAIDVDKGSNANIQYSLDYMSSKYFTIEPYSGELRSAEVFDFEKMERYEVTLNASNSVVERPNPTLFTLKRIIVNIEDINDCPPIFSKDLYSFNVTEGRSNTLYVGRVHVKDDDTSKVYHENVYHIAPIGHNNHYLSKYDPLTFFRITSAGFIYVKVPSLDREQFPNFSFKVIAADQSQKPLSSTAIVQVQVQDMNDNPPKWLFPNTHSFTLNVSYQEAVGYCVARLKASDPDLGDNGKVVYRIVPSSPQFDKQALPQDSLKDEGDRSTTKHELFDLDSSTGNIYIARKLLFEDVGIKSIWVEARDLGNPSLKTHERLLVYITDTTSANLKSHKGGLNVKRGGGRATFENDLMIMIVLVAIIILVAMVMMIIILMLRCRNNGRLMRRNKLYGDSSGRPQRRGSSLIERRPDGHSCSPVNDICTSYSGPKRSHTISTYLGQSAGSSELFDLSTDYLADCSSRKQINIDCSEPICRSMTRIPNNGNNISTFTKKYFTSSALHRPNTLWPNETSPDLSKRLCKRLNNDREHNDSNLATSPNKYESHDFHNERGFNSDFPFANTTKKSITLPNFLTAIEECEDAANMATSGEPLSTFKSQNRLSVTWLDNCQDNCIVSQTKKNGIQYKSADSCLNTPEIQREDRGDHEYTRLNVLPGNTNAMNINIDEYPVTYV